MDNDKKMKIAFALELILFVLVAVMLFLNGQKTSGLSAQITALDEEVDSLQEKVDALEADKATESSIDNEADSSQNASDSNNLLNDLSDMSTADSEMNPVSPTPEPTPTPIPVQYLENIDEYESGHIIEDAEIDMVNIEKYFVSHEIVEGDSVFNRIIDRSFTYNDNVHLSDLRYIKLIHRNYSGQTQVGELIVNVAIEADILDIFMQLYINDYQINSMHLIDDYWTGDGDSSDYASIDVNNTSAFCYRTATGSSSLSKHAYGLAVDLNPLENPYVRFDGDGYGTSAHSNAQAYNNNRSSATTPHVIDHENLAFRIFAEHGFSWGGDWENPKDYQHFQKELS